MSISFNILIATDFSEIASNAERFALDLAADTDSQITFFHAYEAPLPPPKIVTDYERLHKDFQEEMNKKITEHCKQRIKESGHAIKGVGVAIEDPAAGSAILDYVKDNNYDLVVVGTHGASGFIEKLVGTHTWTVIKNASVPVLAIPPEVKYKGLNHIAFATGYREGELPVIQYLASIAKNVKAKLTLVHVTQFTLTKEFEKEMFETFKKEIQGKVNYDQLKMHLVKNDNLTDGVNDFCDRYQVDLLVMAPEKHLFLERIFMPESSATRRMAMHTHVPLMAVPDFYNPDFSEFWNRFLSGDYINEEF